MQKLAPYFGQLINKHPNLRRSSVVVAARLQGTSLLQLCSMKHKIKRFIDENESNLAELFHRGELHNNLHGNSLAAPTWQPYFLVRFLAGTW